MTDLKPDHKGFFISFEGGEGVGKTTQIHALHNYLSENGCDVIATREPGGCAEAETIRDLIFKSKHAGHFSADTETLLMFAARKEHLSNVIHPALNKKQIVLCDRYLDSTRVYQGILNHVDMQFIQLLENNIIKDTTPNLTIILDLEAEIAYKRVIKICVKALLI